MPFELLPWQNEDFDLYPELSWQVFKDDLMGVLYPNGYPQSAREQTAKESLEKSHKHGDASKWFKVVDTDLPSDDPLNKIVSFAHWHFYTKQRSEAELDAEKKESEDESPPEGLNKDFADKFFASIGEVRRKVNGGQPYILLHMLGVRPSHHRRGIGGMHLRWGNEQADRLGLPLFLEASPMGRPVYERFGYEKVVDVWCDAKAFGGSKELPHVGMLRPAKAASQ